MKVKIIGSGSWEGIPVPFCSCRVCNSSKDLNSKDSRTRPEILVETDEGNFLLEASPDIRLQSNKFNLPKISDFLISHWHFDHMYGLLELHAWFEFTLGRNPKLFCSKKTKEWLDFAFGHIPKDIVVVEPYRPFNLLGVTVTPVPVKHMKSQDEDLVEDNLENTFGFVLESNSKKVVYLSDYYEVPLKTIALIKNSDIVILDGTYLFQEEFPDKPEQNSLKNDPDHMHGKDIIKFAKKLSAKQIVFHSISHLPEKLHDELQELLPENMFISYDGMELNFD